MTISEALSLLYFSKTLLQKSSELLNLVSGPKSKPSPLEVTSPGSAHGSQPQPFTSHFFPAFSSVQFSHSVVSDSLQPHESQHARPPHMQTHYIHYKLFTVYTHYMHSTVQTTCTLYTLYTCMHTIHTLYTLYICTSYTHTIDYHVIYTLHKYKQ